MADENALTRGQKALQERSWAQARAAFEEALKEHETPEALFGLAEAAGWLGDGRAALEAGERAFRLLREQGDDEAAARVAAMLAVGVMNALGDAAVASGWLARARTLLRDRPDSPVTAMVAGLEAAVAGQSGDFARAQSLTEEAIVRARAAGDVDLEMLATGQLGLVLVRRGDVEEGMRLLDQATAAAVAGELRDGANAVRVCCFLVTACLKVRDLERAAQWSRYVLDLPGAEAMSGLFDYPRAEHAAVLAWWGRWGDAERELDELLRDAALRPIQAAFGRLQLADLRRRQGRFDEAEALLDELDTNPHRAGLGELTVSARAALELDREQPREAVDLAERYLRAIPGGDVVERVGALEVVARARAALSDLDGAAQASVELDEVAGRIRTGPVRASAQFVHGTIAAARGDWMSARDAFERARELYGNAGAPLEAARARLELARSVLELGRQDAAAKEATAARDEFESLGAILDVERAERLLAQIEPRARGRPDLQLTPREVEVLRLLGQGRSNDEIAAELFLSVRTVERHVANTYAKIGVHGRTARAAATAYAHRNGVV